VLVLVAIAFALSTPWVDLAYVAGALIASLVATMVAAAVGCARARGR
jgi:hypothetical protein